MSSAIQPPEDMCEASRLVDRDILAPTNADPLYDVAQAGQYLGDRGARFVRRIVHERRIPVVRIGGRIRIRQSALDTFLDANTRPAERTGPRRTRRRSHRRSPGSSPPRPHRPAGPCTPSRPSGSPRLRRRPRLAARARARGQGRSPDDRLDRSHRHRTMQNDRPNRSSRPAQATLRGCPRTRSGARNRAVTPIDPTDTVQFGAEITRWADQVREQFDGYGYGPDHELLGGILREALDGLTAHLSDPWVRRTLSAMRSVEAAQAAAAQRQATWQAQHDDRMRQIATAAIGATCPTRQALPGERCVTKSGRSMTNRTGHHAARRDLAEAIVGRTG